MNKSLYLLIIFILITWNISYSYSQNKDIDTIIRIDKNEVVEFDTIPYMVNDQYFIQAYNELTDMLDGRGSLNIKRAEFLIEWAYLEGKPDYKTYCASIDSIVATLRGFIRVNNLSQYKTSGNFALFEYFTKSSLLNNNKPYTYDFEDFLGHDDFTKLFVSKAIRTHSGQCRSLPLLYKILADEMNTEAFLALAPNHLYIKHIDENNRWVNIELTNGHFSTDAYIISSMDISAEAIRNKIYLDALSQKESIAMLLSDLSMAYHKKYGYDNFSLICCSKTLEYFPHYISALFITHNVLQSIGLKYVEKYGQVHSAFIDKNYKEYKDTQKAIEGFGYREVTRENYEKWVRTTEEENSKEDSTD